MARNNRSAVSHDPLTAHKIAVLEAHGQTFTEDPQQPIEDLRPSQVREGAKAAANTVRMIRGMAKRGETLPAVVYTRDGELADGNSTIEGLKREKRANVYGLRLDKTADELGPALFSIGSALNQHGARMGADAARVARRLIKADYVPSRIARDTGLSEATIRNLAAQMKAEDQLDAEKVKRSGLPNGVLTALGRGADLNTEPWLAIAKLTIDAGLSAAEVSSIVRRVRATKSDDEAMTFLKQERKDRGEQIEVHKLSGNGRPPVSRTAVSVLKRFVGLNPRPEVYVERNPELSADALEVQKEVRALLDKIIAEQETVPQAEEGDE